MGSPTITLQPIPGLGNIPLTSDGSTASIEFQQFWQKTIAVLTTNQNSVAASVVNLQAALAAAAAAQATANAAQAAADSGPSATARSGSATSGTINVTTAWTPGPAVALTTVSAGNLTASQNFVAQQFTSISVSAVGQYRIQEIIGLTETTVFTGNWALNSVLIASPPPPQLPTYIVTGSDLSAAALAALNLPLSTTGSIDYRLDFILSGANFPISSAYLFVRRS